MAKYYELISRLQIKHVPRPLRIDGKDIFTTKNIHIDNK